MSQPKITSFFKRPGVKPQTSVYTPPSVSSRSDKLISFHPSSNGRFVLRSTLQALKVSSTITDISSVIKIFNACSTITPPSSTELQQYIHHSDLAHDQILSAFSHAYTLIVAQPELTVPSLSATHVFSLPKSTVALMLAHFVFSSFHPPLIQIFLNSQ
ncbi:hypothetical protein GEMRC1_006904 [Eukaryota sp. GEM-RC1]